MTFQKMNSVINGFYRLSQRSILRWFSILLMLLSFSIHAQQTLSLPTNQSISQIKGVKKIHLATAGEVPSGIEFNKDATKTTDFISNMAQQLGIESESTLHNIKTNTDELGMTHHRFQQKYKGIPVEGMEYRVHERSGHVVSANGKLVQHINVDVKPTLTDPQAFQIAKEKLNASIAEYKPGQLLITSKDFTFQDSSFFLAYQFEIEISLIEKWRVSIDAHSGELINKMSLVHACSSPNPEPYTTGTGLTNYTGSQEIKTEFMDTTYRLRGKTENGILFETFDLKGTEEILEIDFTDEDNDFTDENAKAGVSVHWALEKSLDYFREKHNRYSLLGYGEAVQSYVHYGNEVSNAFYSHGYPPILIFGDGVNNSNPWVDLDMVGHELSHGVIYSQTNLYPDGEMGALSESFADIFGYAIELYAKGGAANWTIGESVKEGGLRDLSDPNKTTQPDTYHGQFWTNNEDEEFGHINSGVQNFWFYLLCHGGSGINDHGQAYNVESIGVENATAIVYRNTSYYIGYYSRLRDSRYGSLYSARDLFGEESPIYQAVRNAWEAVGVSDNVKPIIWDVEATNITGGSVVLNAKLPQNYPLNTYQFEYGTTPAYGTIAYVNSFSYGGYSYYSLQTNLVGLDTNTHYYFRFVASNVNGTSEGSGEFTTGNGDPKVISIAQYEVSTYYAAITSLIKLNGFATSYFLEYGTTPDLGSVTETYMQYPYNYSDTYEITTWLYPLEPYKKYYYRMIVSNQFGSDTTATYSFFAAAKPTIFNIETTKALVGSEILIRGNNFSSIPSENIVHFGATRGQVLASSQEYLTVQVPVGASLGSITYTNAGSGLSTISAQEFVPIINVDFGPDNLELKCTIDGGFEPLQSFIHDLDADLKPDIINLHQGGFSILQNVHSSGPLSESSFLKSSIEVSDSTTALDIADMNGDGRKDIIMNTQNGFRIYLNSSTFGQIVFNEPIDINLPAVVRQLACGDFDSDGWMDVAVEFDGDSISIIKNQNDREAFLSSNFSVKYTYKGESPGQALTCADIDGNGRPDLLMGIKDSARFLVLENYTYSKDFYSFGWSHIGNSILGTGPTSFSIHDLNQDGVKDVAITPDGPEGNLGLFRSGYSGIFFYPSAGLLQENTYKRMVTIADINGDGIPDVVVGTSPGKFSVFLNHTQPFNSFQIGSFELMKEYGTPGTQSGRGLAANDLNGDGKTDLVNITGDGNSIEIWENTATDGPTCPAPTGLSVQSINNSTVNVSWTDSNQVGLYELEYSDAGSFFWNKLSMTTTSQQLYLYIGKQYAFRVRSVCGNFRSSYDTISFSTPCPVPSYLEAYNISVGTANITYYDPYNVGNYKLEYRLAGQDWLTATSNWYLSGLSPGSNYEIRFQVICTFSSSEFIYSSFTTQCPMEIPTISVSSITPTSGKVELSSNFPSSSYFVEYSRDGINWVEVDPDLTVRGLSIGTTYFVRATVVGCVNTQLASITFRTACPSPTDFQVNYVAATSASLSWQDDFDIGHYSIEFTELGIIDWSPAETTSTNHIIEGLVPATSYKARVHAICPERISNREPIFFTTITIPEGHNGAETLMFPNPSDGELTLIPKTNLIGKKAVILDMRGKVMMEGALGEINNIDISSFPAGLFLILVEGEKPIKFSRK